MLILTRKIDQGIVIDGNIIVRVLGVERDRVKIGIAAPTEILILRQELLEREGDCQPEKAVGPDNNAGESAPSPIITGEEPPSDS